MGNVCNGLEHMKEPEKKDKTSIEVGSCYQSRSGWGRESGRQIAGAEAWAQQREEVTQLLIHLLNILLLKYIGYLWVFCFCYCFFGSFFYVFSLMLLFLIGLQSSSLQICHGKSYTSQSCPPTIINPSVWA